MNDEKPPWWASGRLIAKRDVGWDLGAGPERVVLIRYDLRTGKVYCALRMPPHAELRMLEDD